ncbi:hypothetical protein G6L46_30475 [Agrobacterium rhizogenes]|uniref:hypothetical protein n=1 Tax=Rhizobium rhizogenes TaxID=359 RepID=UPI00157260CE|nr:hypothetical protein [Rhizobium rhizogenes]NTF91495.1 hypothetical protein [Rhizobium rhizogenes]
MGEIIARMQSFNHRIAVAAAETPLRDLGIGYQCAICHPDIANAMMATSEGISYAVRKRMENEVAKAINEGAMVYVFVQPRMSSGNTPVSVHFTLQFAGEGATSGSRMIESYNFMKGNGTVTAKELEGHWKGHGIARPAIRSPTSKFELLFAPLPDNSKLAVTDFTHLGPVERDKGLLGSTVYGIAANKRGTIIYQCEKVLRLEVDVQAHRALEVLHRLGEQVYSRGHGTSFGLHTGPSSCLNVSAAALATFFKRSDLCSLPLSDAFVLFCDHATCAYSAKEHGLPITAFSPTNTSQFELVEPQIVKEYVLGLFDAPTMVAPRDSTRASFCSQYIRFREPHQAEEFNEIGVLILSAAAQMLERYAEFLEDGPKDDSQRAQLTSVFGSDALRLRS